MKERLLASVLAVVSGTTLAAGEDRSVDLSPYFEAINDSINGEGYTQPQWQQPIKPKRQKSNQPRTLTVGNINNHSGQYFYENFTYNESGGRVYELEVEPHYLSGYELKSIGTTTFDAVDKRTGEKVKLEVPASAWLYSR